MTQKENSLVAVPATVLTRRFDEEQNKSLRRKGMSSLDQYSRQIARQDDWIICEQPCRSLPRSLTEFISLNLRDEGNALIEETRAINNRYAGRKYHGLVMTLVADIEVLDLQHRVLDWVERAMKEVLYKCRRRILEDAVGLYMTLYRSFVTQIDTGIAHGRDRMYQVFWTRAIDCMCYLLLEGCFLSSGHITYAHSSDAEHWPAPHGPLLDKPGVRAMFGEHANLFGMEPAFYLRKIILEPLARALAGSAPDQSVEEMRREIHSCLGNMLEAFPYLCSSSRGDRYVFGLPGSVCPGAFRFIGMEGFGSFSFLTPMRGFVSAWKRITRAVRLRSASTARCHAICTPGSPSSVCSASMMLFE